MIATGKIADETGVMEFKLRNEKAKAIKKGDTVAFRNGKSILENECIHLEMDKFGKVSQESVKINPKDKPNHSEQKWEKKRSD